MSIRVSERLRLALGAIGAVGGVYVLAQIGLQAFANAAESSGEVYPYKQEDWLRYLVPGLWQSDDDDFLLLTGPSTARENLVGERFEAAFPGVRVFQGGISLGTLADVNASLEYVEKVYGASALPDRIVLGVSARFLAEVPANRPFALGLERYSRWYTVEPDGEGGLELERKPLLPGVTSHARFLATKQTSRYRAAVDWLMMRLVRPADGTADQGSRTSLLHSRVGRLFVPERMIEIGPNQYFREQISPIKYVKPVHVGDAGLVSWMDEPDSFWADVHAWDPGLDSVRVRRRALDLIRFAGEHHIDIHVVSLPERSILRQRYAEEFGARFHRYVQAAFEPLPVLDLRCLLADEEFRDLEHALPDGAARITSHVIRFMKLSDATRSDSWIAAAADDRTDTTDDGCGDPF